MIGQHVEHVGVLITQALRRSKPVHHHIVTSGRRTLQTIQNLQCRQRVPVRVVCMCLQAKAGVGKVGRIDLRAHLKMVAIICLAHIAEPVDYAEQGTVFRRAI